MYSQLLLRRFFKYTSMNIYKRCFGSISNYQPISSHHLLKTSPLVSTFQVRTFWESFPFTRPLLNEKDGLNKEDNKIVYYSRTFNYAFYGHLVTYFAFGTQVFGSLYYAYNTYISEEVVHAMTKLGPLSVRYDLITLLILGVFTLQNLAMYIAAQNVLLRVYFNEKKNEFIFVSLSKNPFKSLLTFCKPGALLPVNSGPLGFILGNHEVDGKRYYLRFDNFNSNYYYNKAVGYKYE